LTVINRVELASVDSPPNQSVTKKDEFQKLIEERFPVKFVLSQAVLVIAISIILIALQIVIYQNDYPFKSQALGIWVALPLLLTEIVCLILSKFYLCGGMSSQ
jgi:hypothetical protein